MACLAEAAQSVRLVWIAPAKVGAKRRVGGYAPMAQSARLKPATILVVENEAIVRLELADWLADLGLLVLEAQDADEAITLLDAHPEIEFLMTDIRMPGSMDGVRLAHHVRGRWPPVKIIVVSGMVETQLSELPHASIFVSKPYDHQMLSQALGRFTTGSQPSPIGRNAA
jgi:two-component system, response regulator PdtaR